MNKYILVDIAFDCNQVMKHSFTQELGLEYRVLPKMHFIHRTLRIQCPCILNYKTILNAVEKANKRLEVVNKHIDLVNNKLMLNNVPNIPTNTTKLTVNFPKYKKQIMYFDTESILFWSVIQKYE